MKGIIVENLSRYFGKFVAVDNISFEIESQTINGFLGPNGAGKTTTIKMLCGILKPTSGKILLNNIDVIDNPELTRMRIGYLSQSFSLYPDLTVYENLEFFGSLYFIKKDELKNRIENLLSRLQLENYKNILTGELPLGIKQRVGIASATIHRPAVIILDEPTSGIDPISRMEFFSFIRTIMKENDTTVILSTHFLNEAEYCDNILLFNKGKIILKGRPVEIKRDFNFNIFEISDADILSQFQQRLKGQSGILNIYSTGRGTRVITGRELTIIDFIRNTGIDSSKVVKIEPTLEDIFIRLME